MAHSLYITYSGGTVNLNSGNIRMMEQYVPRMGDGETTTDSVELEFSGTAVSQIQTSVQAINNAMRDAVRYTHDALGTRCYIYFQPDGYTSAWRSELVPMDAKEWRLEFDNDAMGAARWGGTATKRVKGLLAWKRTDWWEGSKGFVPVSNGNATRTGIEVLVTNCDDGTGVWTSNNWVSVEAADVLGDLPSPCDVEFFFWDNPSRRALYAGANSYNGGTVWQVHLEAESNVTAAAGAGTVAISTASGGSAVSVPIPPGVNTELLRWTGTSAFSNTFNGQFANAFVIFGGTAAADPINNTKYSLAFADGTSGSITYQTDYMYLEGDTINPVQKFTTIQIPPGKSAFESSTLPSNYTIRLFGRQDTAGTITPVIDQLMFIPSTYGRSYYMTNNHPLLIDNVTTGNKYTRVTTTDTAPVEKFTGNGLHLLPGTNQRIHFLLASYAGTIDMHARMQVKAIQYRPRRRLI